MINQIQSNMEESTVQQGHSELIEELFKTYYTPLVKLVYRMLRNGEAAEDIVQDVFVKIWNNRENLDQNKSIKSYLYRSAINTAINYLDRNKKNVQIAKIEAVSDSYKASHSEEKLSFKELEQKVTAAIDTLPPKCRAIFVMSRYEDLSYREIAESLDISIKTVENQIGKALSIMRTQLKAYIK